MEEIVKNEEAELDLVEIFHVMLRKAWMVIMCAVVGAVIAGAYTKMFVTPMYRASSTIYILGKSSISSSGLNVQLTRQLTSDFVVLAKSRPVIEDVIEKLDLNLSYEAVSGMVSVENPTDTSMLMTTVVSADPELAKDIANVMSDIVAERIAEVMVIDKPSTLEEAVLPKYPIGPNLKKNIALGGLTGAALMCALIVLLFILDDTIKDEDDVERYLQLDVLASIPAATKK